MHVPPYHKKIGWQRFFVGAFFGAIIAYCILMYMHGIMYERLITEHQELQSVADDLKRQNEVLSKDNQDLDDRYNEKVAIESIELTIINEKQLKLDRLLRHQLEEYIKAEIEHTIGKPLSSIAENDLLLISAIENKTFKVDDFSYQMQVQTLTISKVIRITLKADLA